jgi:hypothetical protein
MTTLFAVPARQATLAGGINSWESIPELLKCLKIRAQEGSELTLCLRVEILWEHGQPYYMPIGLRIWTLPWHCDRLRGTRHDTPHVSVDPGRVRGVSCQHFLRNALVQNFTTTVFGA